MANPNKDEKEVTAEAPIDASTQASGTVAAEPETAAKDTRRSGEAKPIQGDKSAALQAEAVAAQRASGGRPRATGATGDGDEPVVIRAGGASTVPSEVLGDTDQLVTVQADVWAEVWPEGVQRPSHVLLFHKGQVVPRSQLDAKVAQMAGD